jgi:Iap family predicted aminopeptidase
MLSIRRAAAAAVLVLAAAPPTAVAITVGDVQPHLQRLAEIATANGGTRAAGTPGEAATVEYVAGELAAAGWTVTRQAVPFWYFEERSAPALGDLTPVVDFSTLAYSPPADVTARLVRIRRDGCRARDFSRVPRRAIVLTRLPPDCLFRRAGANAQRAGATALLFPVPATTRVLRRSLIRPGLKIPVLAVERSAVAELRGDVRVRVDAINERRSGTNVIAELAGRSRKVLFAGGHLDSVPAGPGINDNGSGVAALLAIARDIAARTGRAVTHRIGLWSAEEMGLLGSKRYVRSLPPAQRRRIAAYLNLDMVGSPNAVVAVYASTRRIRTALRRRLPRAERESARAPSDQLPFLEAGIPVGGLYTGSEERGPGGRRRDPCYHQPCDTLENVDAALTARMARIAGEALRELAGG